jgi:CRISPR/Cas system-associated endoribonuclease Cas2
MGLFVISYDLNRTKNYQRVYDEMDRLGGHRALESVFLVNLNQDDPNSVLAHFRRFVDDDDTLIVVRFHEAPALFRCRQGTVAWINANCPG